MVIAIDWARFLYDPYDRSDNDRWDRTFYISAIVVPSIAGEWFHMIAAIAEVFFFFLSDHRDDSDQVETGL